MGWVGKSIPRKEDARLIRGQGRFVDDQHSTDMLHLHLLRSPYSHAKIISIDVSKAEALPGVVCTLTGDELAAQSQPFLELGEDPGAKITDYAMAVGKVRYQGEPVVAIVAETPRIAADAAELVEIDYEMLDAVTHLQQSMTDENVLHESSGTNLVWQGVYEYGDLDAAFADAAHVVKIDRLHFHRFSSTPLETNGVIATWDPHGMIDFYCNQSFAGFAVQLVAPALGVSISKIRIKSEDNGGSFGIKVTSYVFLVVSALASKKAGGRTVKWIESRSEHLLGSAHGNERTYVETEVALDKDGIVTAMRSKHLDDCGAFPRYEPLGAVIWSQVLPATYKLRNIRIDFQQYVTTKCPAGPNRGYSRLQHLWFMERVMDICATELGIPGDEMRLRNYITEFPYTTPNGCVYDSGNYPGMLEKAKSLIGWDDWQAKQETARAEGRWLGIGIGTTLDSGTNNFGQAQIINPNNPFSGNSEVCSLKLDLDGSIVAAMGAGPSGQGHETTVSQVVAEELGVDPAMVFVRTGFDSEWNTFTGHSGSYASQFAVTGLSAVHGACGKLKEQMKTLAAFVMEANPDDLEFGMGEQGPEVRVQGSKQSVNYWYLCNLVNANNTTLPDEMADLTLNVRHVYRPPFEVLDVKRKYGNLTLTYAAQLHIAVIEVDADTYQPTILSYAAVDDCGNLINPQIVAGQVHGATAHGIGAALLESFSYDEDGNMLTSSFSDYVPLTALNMPHLHYGSLSNASPFSYNGAKGMGEGGGAPLHAISSALQDALRDEGVIIDDTHNPPGALFELLQDRNRDRLVSVEQR